VEVETLLALVKAAGDRAPHLFLLDELFRGTNAVERIAADQAVLRGLVGGTVHVPWPRRTTASSSTC
jgi:DNA mismatch repair ATPase MutS